MNSQTVPSLQNHPSSILFVCTGNICRSPTAHALMLHRAQALGISLQVDSAAISNEEQGNPVDRRSAAELRRRHVSVPAHRARQVTRQDFARFDWVVGMTQAHCHALRRLGAEAQADKVRLMLDFAPGHEGQDVPDPWYGGERDFIRAFELIDLAVQGLLASWKPS